MYLTFDKVEHNVGFVCTHTLADGTFVEKEVKNRYVLRKEIPDVDDLDNTITYISCPECNYVYNTDGQYAYDEETHHYHYTCPHCGHVYGLCDGGLTPECICNNVPYYRSLYLANGTKQFGNFRLISSTLFKDTESGKFGILGNCVEYFMNIKAHKIICTPFRMKLIFNPKNGMTYFVPPKDMKGKVLSSWTGPNIMNITYRPYVYMMMDKLLAVAGNRIMKQFFNMDDEELLLFRHEQDWFTYARLYNHCPAIRSMCFYQNQYSDFLDILRYFPVGETDASTAILKCMEKVGIPRKKAITRMCMENPAHNLPFAAFAAKCGLKDENSYLKLFSLHDICIYFLNRMTKDKVILKFAKKFIKSKGENTFVKLLLEDKANVLTDTASMYVRIEKDAPHLIPLLDNKKPFWKKKLRIMHDELSFLVTKIRYANMEIPYQASELTIEDVINGYSFEYAKDTDSLVVCGQTLKICVGNYRDYCLNKQGNLLFIKKGEEFVGCSLVWYNPNKNRPFTLGELKGYRNNNLKGEAAAAVRAWVAKHNIVVRTSDYARMDTNCREMDGDWHEYEMVDGEVVRIA